MRNIETMGTIFFLDSLPTITTNRVRDALERSGLDPALARDLSKRYCFSRAKNRMKDDGLLEKFSSTGRQVILYFREIHEGEPITFPVEMRANYPVKVKSPSSSVYQYYEPGLRDETEPVELEIY